MRILALAILIFCTGLASPATACRNPDITASLLPERPKGNFKVVAKVEVVELLKPLGYQGSVQASFNARAKVLEAEFGASINQIVQISIDASSCDVPVVLGQIGYIASDKIT